MKKIIKPIVLILAALSLCNPALAVSGSSQANTAGIKEGINAGANGAMGAQNAAKCSPKSPMPCIIAAASFAQLAMSLMQMMQSMGGRDDLAPNFDWTNPDFKEDFGPVGDDDDPWLDPIIDAVENGDITDYDKARQKLLDKAGAYTADLAKKGYSVDLENGTVTTPNGTQNLADLNLQPDSSMADYMDRANKALGELDMSGGGGMIAADGSAGGAGFGKDSRGLASFGDDGGSKSGVDSFLDKLKKGEMDSKMAGLSKSTANGDRIGVAMNNIFKMIQQKYTSIDKQKGFLDQ